MSVPNADRSDPPGDDIPEMPEMTAEEQLAMLQLSEKIMRKQERILSEQLYKLKIEEVTLRRIINNQKWKGCSSMQSSYSQGSAPLQQYDAAGSFEYLGPQPPLPPITLSEMPVTAAVGPSAITWDTLMSGSEYLGSQPPPPPIAHMSAPLQFMGESQDSVMGNTETLASQPSTTGSQTLYDSLYY